MSFYLSILNQHAEFPIFCIYVSHAIHKINFMNQIHSVNQIHDAYNVLDPYTVLQLKRPKFKILEVDT